MATRTSWILRALIGSARFPNELRTYVSTSATCWSVSPPIAGIGTAQTKWLADSRRVVYAYAGEIKILDAVTGDIRTVEGTTEAIDRVLEVLDANRTLLVSTTSNNDDVWIVDTNTAQQP